ncbi:MAG: hypothetical protein J2P45_08290, partial [Candidatus Dormibacteraeota bacterium]|nr:hypothetical protein [Candidatus Dormibacteraeota bacterium]
MGNWRKLGVAAMVVLLAAACGNGTSNGGAKPHNNVLFYAVPGEPDSLDPATGASGFDPYVTAAIFDPLISINPKTNALAPGLATSWTWVGADKLTFRLNLRHGVKFQDGTPFNAEAVKTSMTHFLTTATFNALQPIVAGETVVDDYTLDINLKRQYSPLPNDLTAGAGYILSPAALQKYGKDINRNPVGAGPFSFKVWNSGTDLQVTRFAGYWNASTIHFAGITYKVIPNQLAEVNALKAGQVDFAPLGQAPEGIINALKSSKNLTTRAAPIDGMAILVTNDKAPPFNNVLVRRAANMAINRQALSDAMNGKGVGAGPAWEFVAKDDWNYTKDIPNPGYHPDQAKQLLAQAGFPNGVNVTLCHFASDQTDSSVEKAQMAPAGFNVTIDQEPVNACIAKTVAASTNMVQLGSFTGPNPFESYNFMFNSL